MSLRNAEVLQVLASNMQRQLLAEVEKEKFFNKKF